VGGQQALVGGRIDASGEARHDHDPSESKLAAELCRHLQAVVRRPSRTDDTYARGRNVVQPPADVQQLGYLTSAQQALWIGTVAAADDTYPSGLQLSPSLAYGTPGGLHTPGPEQVARLGTCTLDRSN